MRYYENFEGIICGVLDDMFLECKKGNGVLVLKTTNGMSVKEDWVKRRVPKKEFQSLELEDITTDLSRFYVYKIKC